MVEANASDTRNKSDAKSSGGMAGKQQRAVEHATKQQDQPFAGQP